MDWFDLDAASSLALCSKRLRDRETRNFAVTFNTDKAHGAIDLTPQDVESLIHKPTEAEPRTHSTRWLNFWAGHKDADSIKAIARRYGLSSRLAAQLCAARAGPKRPPIVDDEKEYRHKLKDCVTDAHATNSDIESASGHSVTRSQSRSEFKSPGFGDIVDNLWHFCSVDRGPDYICLGFNALFNVPDGLEDQHRDSSKPAGLRIWTSLLLCSDCTVVSVFEMPPFDLSPEHILNVRYNVLNVFGQLSKLSSAAPVSTMMQVGVRPFSTADTAGIADSESAALLFFYLFDDWRATYSLITQQDHPYRDTLSRIRREMFQNADTDLIKSLDLVGRQLTVLKLIYQSYELIIQRILRHSESEDSTRSEARRVSLMNQFSGLPDLSSSQRSATLPMQETASLGDTTLNLPLSARVRFERLRDRVRLYALTEIEECLKEKDSLVFMVNASPISNAQHPFRGRRGLTSAQNFNLVSLTESQAVETLTRTTILLAKATILFLPVSLMTGYFSVQLQEIDNLYSLTTYWVCFMVVVLVSILGLVVFDGLTSKVRGRMTYKSLTRMGVERLKRRRR